MMTLQIKNRPNGISIASLCAAIGICKSTYCRWNRQKVQACVRKSHRALSCSERTQILDHLHSDRFVDASPSHVYAALLDEGIYLCSERSMYRILHDAKEVRERRQQSRRTSYAAPELMADKPNMVWSWDITKLKGPPKTAPFHLYVIIDIYSRYVVGWMIAHKESKQLATRLIHQTCVRHKIQKEQLTIHADRGSSMRSKAVSELLCDLGVKKTHSRPYVSDDNPYSESQFKTLKYHAGFPERFGSIQDSRSYLGPFFDWYNNTHRHSGIAMMTPSDVHHGRIEARRFVRTQARLDALERHPERFAKQTLADVAVPTAAWINPPKKSPSNDEAKARQQHANEVDASGSPEPVAVLTAALNVEAGDTTSLSPAGPKGTGGPAKRVDLRGVSPRQLCMSGNVHVRV